MSNETETGVSPPSPWMTRTEAAEYLRVNVRTFDNWVAAGRVRRYTVAGSAVEPRYSRAEVEALITNG